MTRSLSQCYARGLILAAACTLCACDSGQSDRSPFVEVTQISGLDFQHVNGLSGRLHLPGIMGGGVALLDYDADGDLDVYLVQSGRLPGEPAADSRGTDQLFRNISTGASIRFENVSTRALPQTASYAMGAAAGDVNNDGYPDVYVTAFDNNRLLLNDGHGGFVDITELSGAGSNKWSVSATFVDVNMDGWLDLYVGNFVDYSLDDENLCHSLTSAPDYCTASQYRAQADQLFVHQGLHADGYPVYLDQSSEYGIADRHGPTLGVVSADINADQWPDIIATGNRTQNLVWINEQGKRFHENAQLSGMAYALDGEVLASHGVDINDYDLDGDPDVLVTQASGQASSLYTQRGELAFIDVSAQTGLANSSYSKTGFGVVFADFDGDHLPDIFVANGAVSNIQSQIDASDDFPLRETNQLIKNMGNAFIDVSHLAWGTLQDARVSRGVASGDVDNDGDLDLVIANNNGMTQILQNTLNPTEWTGVVPRLAIAQRVALDARVTCDASAQTVTKQVKRSGSYASSSDPRVRCLASGDKPRTSQVTVVWPDGQRESFLQMTPGKYHDLVQGMGLALTEPEDADEK